MYAVNNSIRALIVAVMPLGAVHAVSFAMLLLRTQTKPALLALPSPDHVLALYVVQLAIDTTLLFAGHMVLRERAVSGRLAYALMGGAMAVSFSYAAVLRYGLLLSPPSSGSVMTAGLLPTFAGMMAGFLYCQFAGLAPACVWPRFSVEGLNTSCTFDGPLPRAHIRRGDHTCGRHSCDLDRNSLIRVLFDLPAPGPDASRRRPDHSRGDSRRNISDDADRDHCAVGNLCRFCTCITSPERFIAAAVWNTPSSGGLMGSLCGIVIAPFTAR